MSELKKDKFNLDEVCAITGVDTPILLVYIERDWIAPFTQAESVFDEEDVARIRLIRELQEKLGVNDESVPLVLHLVDQICFLRERMRRLETSQPWDKKSRG